jgi:hypothetical protein
VMLPRIAPEASMKRLRQILDLEVCHIESLACGRHAGAQAPAGDGEHVRYTCR